jgi:acetyltransferase-like isoleucine patch superfamily enzyme
MSWVQAVIRASLPSGAKSLLRPLAQRLQLMFRRAAYAMRFAGLNVRIHPTAWVARRAILRCTGGGELVIGRYCEIHDFAMLDAFGGSIHMGDHCSLNPFAILYGHGGTRIGNGVRIAAHTVVIPANHNFRTAAPLHEAGVTGRGITIEDDVWLGAGVRVLDGVTIGSRSVVGAGGVVTRSIPPVFLAIGVPARAIPIQKA